MTQTKEPQALAVIDPTQVNVAELFRRNAELLEQGKKWSFPQGPAPTLYTQYLEHVPFVLTGEIKWATKPASTIKEKDEAGNITGTRTIPAQDCVEMKVCLVTVDTETGNAAVGEPKTAILQGMYLLNQIRSLQESEHRSMLYGGYIWTIRRNPEHTTIGGTHPFMLAVYDPSQDEAKSTF